MAEEPILDLEKILERNLFGHIKELTDSSINFRSKTKFDENLQELENRFQAKRSVRGLKYGELPKTNPWPGCSDIGIPVEAITIQSITARADRVEFERLPITRVTPVGPADAAGAPKIEAFLDWQKMNLMQIRIPKLKWTRKSLTLGGWFIKGVFEEDFVYDDQDFYGLADPDTHELLKDEEGGYVHWEATEEEVPHNAEGKPYVVVPFKEAFKRPTYRGPKFYGRDPRNILWSENETSHDPKDWDWWADCYERSVEWLDTVGREIGLKNVDQLMSRLLTRANEAGVDSVDRKKTIKLREWYGKYEIKGKMRWIVGVIAKEEGVFLGWTNDLVREKLGLCRLINRCPIPLEGEVLGMAIGKFIKGIRDAIDAVINSMIDRASRYNNPPVIYAYGSGFDPKKHNFGYKFWPEKTPGTIRELPMQKAESQEFSKLELFFSVIQRLFGVTDTTAGMENPKNQTYGGIVTLLAEGNVNIDMILQALNESNIRMDELIIGMNSLYLQRDAEGNPLPIEFPIIDDYSSVMEDPENPFMSISEDELIGKYNYYANGSSLSSNTRQLREEAGFLFEKVMTFAGVNPFLQDLNVMRESTSDVFKSFGKKNVVLPSVEEMQAKILQQQQMALAAGAKDGKK